MVQFINIIVVLLMVLPVYATYNISRVKISGRSSKFMSEASRFFRKSDDVHASGTRWAVLIAGSNGWENNRHQAGVCHAYQILRKDGLKDENIVVFMYDDIAFNMANPRQGVIINNPNGEDVYHGVPKFRRAPEDSPQKVEAQKQIVEALTHRMFIDNSVDTIGKILFGIEKGPQVLKTIRLDDQAHVDDWDCL